MHPDIEQHVQAALSPLRVSWSFMLTSSFAWAALGLFASPVMPLSYSSTATSWTTTLVALGVLSAGATLLIDRAVITPKRMAAVITVPDQALIQRHLLAGHLVLWSFAQLPALFGFAQLLLDGSLGPHLALCAVSLAILAQLMPTRARIMTRMEAVLR
jgi:hypothetical protein